MNECPCGRKGVRVKITQGMKKLFCLLPLVFPLVAAPAADRPRPNILWLVGEDALTSNGLAAMAAPNCDHAEH